MSRKQRQSGATQGNNSSRRKIEELEQLVRNNAEAVSTGPAKKTWYKKDMKVVRPMTANQEIAFNH